MPRLAAGGGGALRLGRAPARRASYTPVLRWYPYNILTGDCRAAAGSGNEGRSVRSNRIVCPVPDSHTPGYALSARVVHGAPPWGPRPGSSDALSYLMFFVPPYANS